MTLETSVIQREVSRAEETAASPLITYVLKGLRNCWMPEHGRWSHIYHLDGRAVPNESIPQSDVFYTLNVLLGFSRISHLPDSHAFDVTDIFARNVALVTKLNCQKYAYGMALWAGAELQQEITADVLREIESFILDRNHWETLRAQDLGMILIGCVRQASQAGRKHLGEVATDLFRFLRERYSCPTGLFFDTAKGFRRNFSSFATNTYLTLASFMYGEWAGDKNAIELAKFSTRKLIDLQGPQGEWPWFFYTPGGRVVDFYEVYSVHQSGMAPAFLECAERFGLAGATEAFRKGFHWILGENQLGKSMLWKEKGLIGRSHVRKGELHDRRKRACRAAANALMGKSGSLTSPSEIELRLECRSYELGWILWSLGRRSDLNEIQNHSEFV